MSIAWVDEPLADSAVGDFPGNPSWNSDAPDR
jgi:hypothetical protein